MDAFANGVVGTRGELGEDAVDVFGDGGGEEAGESFAEQDGVLGYESGSVPR
ncbi:hypothetical protein AB0K40_10315 [Nonomuraea bangladeshensis]|uniref:Uncharacterized protein n=1 Tax=Nonomuraea bangladeshensis TaxID=404385 RepID=A0ABV3H025_9ACTN